MIDWYSVSFNALWIFGIGLVTAGLSLASYLGRRFNWRYRQALRIRACINMIGWGLVLFCIGLACGVSTLWEHIVWAVLALIFALQTWRTRTLANP